MSNNPFAPMAEAMRTYADRLDDSSLSEVVDHPHLLDDFGVVFVLIQMRNDLTNLRTALAHTTEILDGLIPEAYGDQVKR